MLQELLSTCQMMYSQVDQIEDVKICKVNNVEKKFYKVRWKCTWEPASILEKICGNMIEEYIHSHKEEMTDVPDHNSKENKTATTNISETWINKTQTGSKDFIEIVKSEYSPIVTNSSLENKENHPQSISIDVADDNERLLSKDTICANDITFEHELDIKFDTGEYRANIFNNLANKNDIEAKLLEVTNMQSIHQNGQISDDKINCQSSKLVSLIQSNIENHQDTDFPLVRSSTLERNGLICSSLDIGKELAEIEDRSHQHLLSNKPNETVVNVRVTESSPNKEVEEKMKHVLNIQSEMLLSPNVQAQKLQSQKTKSAEIFKELIPSSSSSLIDNNQTASGNFMEEAWDSLKLQLHHRRPTTSAFVHSGKLCFSQSQEADSSNMPLKKRTKLNDDTDSENLSKTDDSKKGSKDISKGTTPQKLSIPQRESQRNRNKLITKKVTNMVDNIAEAPKSIHIPKVKVKTKSLNDMKKPCTLRSARHRQRKQKITSICNAVDESKTKGKSTTEYSKEYNYKRKGDCKSKIHTGEKIFKCHIATHTGIKPFKCNICSYASARKLDLKYHHATHTGKKPYKCDQCSYATVRKDSLKVHLARHNRVKPFKCDQCSFAAVTKYHLKSHLATHNKEKPFKCNQCSYTAVTKWQLKSHLATHTGVKPFKCNQCSYAAVRKAQLKFHLARNTGVKPFKCNQCSFTAVTKCHLKSHLVKHTGVKPFKCDQCSYAAVRKHHLKRHLAIHRGVKPNESG